MNRIHPSPGRSVLAALFLLAAWGPLASHAAHGATLPTPQAHRGGMINQKEGKGPRLLGYLSLPKGAGTHAGIVAIQEWWGLNDWVKAQADSLAAHGYVVFAPDLYDGKVAYDQETAHQLMSGLVEEDGMAKLRAAVDFLRSREDVRAHAIGVIGWCMGGNYAIRLAAADPGIRACVMYYGAPLNDPASIRNIQAAILGNYGAEDQGLSPEQVKKFEAALRTAGKSADFKIYPGAGHAFANEDNPWGGYRPAAAKDAWQRTVAFFDRYLKRASLPGKRG
ncbi:MAG TPA: dienelactone hydrolase family protein [Candidatus Dormibacteraeota bacterium]|nr:dienelactone hydrolase family protein [Candidatus Dormibacteraeota bacterium]